MLTVVRDAAAACSSCLFCAMRVPCLTIQLTGAFTSFSLTTSRETSSPSCSSTRYSMLFSPSSPYWAISCCLLSSRLSYCTSTENGIFYVSVSVVKVTCATVICVLSDNQSSMSGVTISSLPTRIPFASSSSPTVQGAVRMVNVPSLV